MRVWRLVATVLCLGVLLTTAARGADADLCARAIARSEAAGVLPAGLLTAVAVAELGRYDRDQRGTAAWPWTVNNAGDGRYFASKGEAIAHVERLRAAGERNIDVGCMQINLMHHPNAFASLDEAFEPGRNVAYGASYLQGLEKETGSWNRAVERYHTADPDRGRDYRERVYQRWARAPLDVGPGSAASPRVLQASLSPGEAVAVLPRRITDGRRQLRPLRGNGFISLRGTGSRVDILRPSADRQLKPIVRPPRRSSYSLVRLSPSRRSLAFLTQ